MNRAVQLWECDRCHAEEKGEEVAFQPKEWISVRIVSPPNGAYPDPSATLCGACAEKLARWCRPPENRGYVPGPKTPPTAELAAVMAEAEAQGRTPRGLLGERYGVSESTAYRYIKRVRNASRPDGRVAS